MNPIIIVSLILSLFMLTNPNLVLAYDVKCLIEKGPKLKIDNVDTDLSGESFEFSKDQDSGNFVLDLPNIGATETRFQSSSLDSSSNKCSPYFESYLNDRQMHFTIDFPLTLASATPLFDSANSQQQTMSAIIRAEGTYQHLGMNFKIVNSGNNAGATLKCSGKDLALFIADIQKTCTGIDRAYQYAKANIAVKGLNVAQVTTEDAIPHQHGQR